MDLDGVNALLIALCGGLVGAILSQVVGVPTTVKLHNADVEHADEDLGQWVADEMVRFDRALRQITNEKASRGQSRSGGHGVALMRVHEDTLHRYRDQVREAEQLRTRLEAAEDWHHSAWRFFSTNGHWPELTTLTKAEPVVDFWRKPDRYAQALGAKLLSDPTTRTLDSTLDELTERDEADAADA